MSPSSPDSAPTVDVLVTGGGPTGLIVTYILLKAGLNVLAVEQHDKEQQGNYGRACVLFPRSLEILDQLGLYDGIAEVGFINKNGVTYKGGENVGSRNWYTIFNAIHGNTQFDYCFVIRQKMSESSFRRDISNLKHDAVHAPAKLLDYTLDPSHKYPVLSKIELNGKVTEIRSKYLVGADGGRSTVRNIAKIPFPGVASKFRWVRLDALVRTDMPASRKGAVALESSTHGNILWVPCDNGLTRIGFVLPDELYGENGEGITPEMIKAEAQKAVKPFSLEFVTLDWWTVYSIGQRVADKFREGPVLLAGDAGHTHSSGVAQGMNTGIHDASNLGWKLAGVLKGWYSDAVLDTYATERRAFAQQLIQLDKDLSSLISGVIPAHFNAPPDADTHVYFDKVLATNAAFTVGLGISYEENIINKHDSSVVNPSRTLRIGHRAPDPPLFRPGARFPKRLQELTPNKSRFWVLVFPGGLDPGSDQPRLRKSGLRNLAALRLYIESPQSFTNTLAPAFEFLTIIRGNSAPQTAEALGGQPLGKAVYDYDGEAYERYGIDDSAGALIVLRPDGIIGFMAAMSQYEAVSKYFAAFVKPLGDQTPHKATDAISQTTTVAMGEISLEDKVEETQLVSMP